MRKKTRAKSMVKIKSKLAKLSTTLYNKKSSPFNVTSQSFISFQLIKFLIIELYHLIDLYPPTMDRYVQEEHWCMYRRPFLQFQLQQRCTESVMKLFYLYLII